MFIDAHAHLAKEPKDLERMVYKSPVKQAWLLDISFYLSGREVESASSDEILEVSRQYPGYFIPFGFLDFTKTPDIVDRLKEKGFYGLKAIRPMHPYDDERYFPFYERAQKLNMPIVFHTGIVSNARSSTLLPGISTCSSHMRPAYLMGVASEFPKLIIVAAHLGMPWGEEAFLAAKSFPNIYLDLSGGGSEYKIRWLDKYLHKGVAQKLILAIDATYGRENYHNDILRMYNFWNDYFDIILRTHEAYRHKESIFYKTAGSFINNKFSRGEI